MFGDISISIIICFFIHCGSKMVNYYYNFYHIYRYLDTYQKLNYFKNIKLIKYLNKYTKIKNFFIYYILIPTIKLNYIIISLFTSMLYSLCEKDFENFIAKRGMMINLNKSRTNIDNHNPAIYNKNVLEELNTDKKIQDESTENLKINLDNDNSDNDNSNNDNSNNDNSDNDNNLINLESKISKIIDFSQTSLTNQTNLINQTNSSNYSDNLEFLNMKELDFKDELKLIDNKNKPKSKDKDDKVDKVYKVDKYTKLNLKNDEEDISNYIVIDKESNNTKTSIKITNTKPDNNLEIIETIRIDEIDFGENINNIFNEINSGKKEQTILSVNENNNKINISNKLSNLNSNSGINPSTYPKKLIKIGKKK